MRRIHAFLSALPIALVLLSCAAAAQEPVLEPFVAGTSRPVAIAHAHDDRLFVVEQAGRVLVVKDGARLPEPFLDVSGQVSSEGERGLLGLAFPADHAASGRFYAYYTDRSGTSVLSRFTVSSDPDRADPGSEEVLITQDQPAWNHNGGQLAFGPDGYLYWGLGDGGAQPRAAQDLGTLLGKVLRLDVSTEFGYAVPPSNPFAAEPGAAAEIWAYGLRNPWRFSFDRATGDLYIADVGQNEVEEVNFQPASSPGGENYGWNIMEGDRCFQPASGCDAAGLTLPVITYVQGRSTGNSITGGYVYRGSLAPELTGRYVFGDYVSGRVWAASAETGWEAVLLWDTDLRIATFGEDAAGELYVADYGSGSIYKVGSSR